MKHLLPILLSLAISSFVSAGVVIEVDVDTTATDAQSDLIPNVDFSVDLILSLDNARTLLHPIRLLLFMTQQSYELPRQKTHHRTL